MLRPASDPFKADGGLRLVDRQSRPRRRSRPAPSTRNAGSSRRRRSASPIRTRCSTRSRRASSIATVAVVVRFQGPRANGMPELHKLTPVARRASGPGLRGRAGHRRADVGRGGKVPAAIHVTPEALPDGPLARVRDGDLIRLDGHSGRLEALGVDLAARAPANSPPPPIGTGRELFALMRRHVSEAEAGRRRCSPRWKESGVRKPGA